MIDVIRITNYILRAKGNLLRINFAVEGKDYKVFVPDDQLFGAIKDVLLNREYEYIPEFELLNYKGKRVVDVGAHVGLFSLVASTFADEVISIEPHPLNFKLLEINKIINNAENIIPLNKALWFEKTTLELYEGTHTGSHSILQNYPSKKYLVQSMTLEEIIDEFGRIDLLKMDIEGSEFEIFRKLDANILRKIEHLCIEIHLQKGNISWIVDFLTSNRFRIENFYPPLVKKQVEYPIEVNNLLGLKVLRNLIYGLSSLIRMKDKTLMILFGRKR